MNSNFRILPLLIVVAMLTFSVRIADFAMGVSSLSGQANAQVELAGSKTIAEQIAARQDPEEGGEKEMSKELEVAQAEEKESMEGSIKVTEVPNVDVPDVKWRDASDQEVDYSNVRIELFDDLTERRETLNKREKSIMTREALLRAAEQELDRKFQELSALRLQIEELLQQQSDEEKARISSLVKIYEGMKPKDAARIFDTLDLDVLVSVMGQMSERKLSPVIAAMNPERARTVTIMLAEQKKLPELPTLQ
ncbi:MAG: MotE family protein [Bdellovibrionales bacterium]